MSISTLLAGGGRIVSSWTQEELSTPDWVRTDYEVEAVRTQSGDRMVTVGLHGARCM
ncbi:MAG: hypothetical protein U0175_04930 [Caldilineaceae bacterium]